MVSSDTLLFEQWDNFQKQTYRNRTYVYGANGLLMLSIPIVHTGKGRQAFRDVKIENNFPWQQQHWKSLETAYRTSPFFEYYEEEFVHLYEKKKTFLMDFALESMHVIFECLPLNVKISKTEKYLKSYPNDSVTDFRSLAKCKKEPDWKFSSYIQVFGDKHGFLSNLSVLDLLFNEGTNALMYLENQVITNKLFV